MSEVSANTAGEAALHQCCSELAGSCLSLHPPGPRSLGYSGLHLDAVLPTLPSRLSPLQACTFPPLHRRHASPLGVAINA
ncbi:hypothetical protein E2C01_083853 [Portunus trituberculatus]|uniref:Uncharacterized protein n=1 Tax=Portunus trituberculatus TaxID=210409 RepID=A0A5B7J2Q7_PORTR|nr:hypothetical protein [Portunus trituberculatus]